MDILRMWRKERGFTPSQSKMKQSTLSSRARLSLSLALFTAQHKQH